MDIFQPISFCNRIIKNNVISIVHHGGIDFVGYTEYATLVVPWIPFLYQCVPLLYITQTVYTKETSWSTCLDFDTISDSFYEKII